MNFAGCRFQPHKDVFSLRYPIHSNGRKWRGKLNPPRPKRNDKGEIIKIPFINEEFKLKEQITSDNINRIYEDVPKTLQLVVSLGSKCYDMNGVATPLVVQLRTTISKIMQTTDGWDGRVAPEQWNS